MGAYHCRVTPETQDRNPFISIAVLVVVMALVAGLATRFGINSLVAAICVALAMFGTWVLLSPQIEILESAATTSGDARVATPGAVASGGVSSVSAFAGKPASAAREGLRSTPRVAVGFDTPTAERPGTHEPARLASFDSGSFVESVAPVQALGQLPQDASALQVSTTVEPSSNVSGAYTLGQFEVRASSRRGSDHVILNDLRQDDYVVASAANGRYLVVVVADGQGAAENAHYGSYWSCRLLAQAIDQHLRDGVPGIEKMLERTRDELQQLFDMRFTDGTKMRTIATTLVGLIAPVDGGPAAGFRVGNSDLLVAGADGWTSVFGASSTEADAVFPRTIDADVAPLELDGACLMLATDGVAGPITANDGVAMSLVEALQAPVSEVEFDQLMSFPLEEARGDRTAVGVWFSQK
jgi:hypothetical protein